MSAHPRRAAARPAYWRCLVTSCSVRVRAPEGRLTADFTQHYRGHTTPADATDTAAASHGSAR